MIQIRCTQYCELSGTCPQAIATANPPLRILTTPRWLRTLSLSAASSCDRTQSPGGVGLKKNVGVANLLNVEKMGPVGPPKDCGVRVRVDFGDAGVIAGHKFAAPTLVNLCNMQWYVEICT